MKKWGWRIFLNLLQNFVYKEMSLLKNILNGDMRNINSLINLASGYRTTQILDGTFRKTCYRGYYNYHNFEMLFLKFNFILD